MPQSGGFSSVDDVDPPARAGRVQPLVEREAGDPGADQPRGATPVRRTRPRACSARRRRASRRAAPRTAARRPSRGGAGSSGSWRSRRRAHRRSRSPVTSDDEERLRRAREGVLERHRRRVGVRERLVRLGHEQREERDDRGEPAGDDGGGKRGRVAEVAREHEHGAEREQPRVRDEVADSRTGERAAPRRREARVVGGVRDPRDRDPDDDVCALPDARARPRPRRSRSPPRSAPSSAHHVR